MARAAPDVTTPAEAGPAPAGGAVFYSRSDAGHRASYAATLGRMLGLRRVGLLAAIVGREPVLFLMIEERPVAYALACLVRAAAGRRTAGLLFRPGAAMAGGGLRLWAKRRALRALRRLSACRTLAIEPIRPGEAAEAICDGWIHDPQLWDLETGDLARAEELRAAPAPGLPAEAARVRDGRRLVAAIGRQDARKGFDRFARLYAENAALRRAALFVAGGEVAAALRGARDAMEAVGGVVADRRIDEDELLGLYALADAIWCVHAPDYDQASGIFGRAAQLGVPAIVRRGARIHRFCEAEGIAHLAVGAGEAPDLSALPERGPPPLEATRARRRESLAILGESLGLRR